MGFHVIAQCQNRPWCRLIKWKKHTTRQWTSVTSRLYLFSLFSIVFSCYVVTVTVFLFLAKKPCFMLATGASSSKYIKLHRCRVQNQSPGEKAELCIALVYISIISIYCSRMHHSSIDAIIHIIVPLFEIPPIKVDPKFFLHRIPDFWVQNTTAALRQGKI